MQLVLYEIFVHMAANGEKPVCVSVKCAYSAYMYIARHWKNQVSK